MNSPSTSSLADELHNLRDQWLWFLVISFVNRCKNRCARSRDSIRWVAITQIRTRITLD